MKRLFVLLAAMAIAWPAMSQTSAVGIGSTIKDKNSVGYTVELNASKTAGTYVIGESFPKAVVGFDLGSAFEGTLYACETPAYAAATCTAYGTTLDADIASGTFDSSRRWYVLTITTAETGSNVSYLTIYGTFDLGGGGAGVEEYAFADFPTDGDPSVIIGTDCDDANCGAGGGSTRVALYWDGDSYEAIDATGGVTGLTNPLAADLDPNGKAIGARIYYVNTEAEFEAALTACGDGIGVSGQTGCVIQLEGAVIDISDGVTIAGATAGTQGRSGLVIRGAGGYGSVSSSGFDNVGTVLNWTGAGAGSVLSIGACFGCEISGIGINGNDLATAGIEVLSTSGAPAKLNVHDMGIWDINGTAILGNTSTGQFDESNFSNIMIRDSSKCFHSRHSQSLANVLGPNFICTQMNGTGPFIDIQYGGATLYNSYVAATSDSSTLVHLGSTANSLYVRDSVFEFGSVSSITAIDADDGATNSNVKRIIIDGNRFTYTTTGNVAIDADLRGYIAVTNNFANQPSGTNDITAPSISITNEISFGGNRTYAWVQNNARQSLHASYTDYPDPWLPSIGDDVWLDPGSVVADSDDSPTTCLNGQTKIVNSTGALTSCVSNAWIDPPNLAAATGDTYTGAHDFGGATSVEVPNSAAPTTDATGEIALDTTITDHQPLLQYYDGGENMTVIAIDTSQLPAQDDEIIKYDAATDKFVLEADAGSGSFDATAQDALTWSDGANASNAWTFNVSGTDPVVTWGNGTVDFSTPITASSFTADASDTAEVRMTSATGADEIAIGLTDNGTSTSMDFTVDDGTGDDQQYLLLDGANAKILASKPIQAPAFGATSTGGALAVNSITLATAAGDYDLPDSCDSATFNYVTLMVRDVSETASLTVTDTGDAIVYKGLTLDANDELDSPGAAMDSVTVVCMEADKWYVTANSGDWTDGGAAD